MEITLDHWLLAPFYTAHEVAALITGTDPDCTPHNPAGPVMRRLRSDFELAVSDRLYSKDPYPSGEVQDKALQSIEMRSRYEPNADLLWGEEDTRTWLKNIDSESLDSQTFSKNEIARWLLANGINSKFSFCKKDVTAEPEREDEKALSVTGSTNNLANVSDNLAILKQAAAKFWANADRDDRTTHPSKPDVVAWLIARGFSEVTAQSGATIIRPKWARTGRKAKE